MDGRPLAGLSSAREAVSWNGSCSGFLFMKLALRNLLRNPAFASTAVLSLALAIGANTAIFTLMNQIPLRVVP